MRRRKETEEEAVKRRQQMYGCNGKCCDRVIDPETGEGQYFICGGIDTCDEDSSPAPSIPVLFYMRYLR